MSALRKLCPRCQAPAPQDASVCLRAGCGHQFRQNPNTQPADRFPANCCCWCGDPGIRRLSAILHEGTWAEASSGSSASLGHVFGGGPNFGTVGISSARTYGATTLAQALAPPVQPPPPHAPQPWQWVAWGSTLAFFSLIGMCTPQPLWASGAVLFPVLLLGLYQVSKGFHQEAMRKYAEVYAHWQQELHRWEQVFYCPKCDHVFHWQERVPVGVPALAMIIAAPPLPYSVQ